MMTEGSAAVELAELGCRLTPDDTGPCHALPYGLKHQDAFGLLTGLGQPR
jgi:hypothetical protein